MRERGRPCIEGDKEKKPRKKRIGKRQTEKEREGRKG